MSRFALLVLLVVRAASPQSQPETPRLLRRVVHCLDVKNFLELSGPAEKAFGYLLDEKSYPNHQVVYVVEYASARRSNGHVFAVFVSTENGREHFDIQNNASFKLLRGPSHEVDFKDAPLGGTWTQEHLASAIQQIEKQPRFSIRLKGLSPDEGAFTCEAYTDPQPKGN